MRGDVAVASDRRERLADQYEREAIRLEAAIAGETTAPPT
jgi:hypothetical protein